MNKSLYQSINLTPIQKVGKKIILQETVLAATPHPVTMWQLLLDLEIPHNQSYCKGAIPIISVELPLIPSE